MTVERHVFSQRGRYDYKDPATHVQHETIYALFLRDSSLIVEEQMKALGPNGGHYYKTQTTHYYKAYTNRHGQRYLKSYTKNGKGQIRPKSVGSQIAGSMRQDPYLYSNSRDFCPEMVTVLEKQFSKMLGYEFKRTRCPRVIDYNDTSSPEMLSFPFMRTPQNHRFALDLLADKALNTIFGQGNYLRLTTEGKRSLTKALRDCASQEELITQIVYKSAVKGEEDIRYLLELPTLRGLFHSIDLKMGAKEVFDAGYAEIFVKHDQIMPTTELLAFKYLLANLPKVRLGEVYALLSRLAACRKRVEDMDRLVAAVNRGTTVSCYGHPPEIVRLFKKVAPADRQRFASLFWDEFQKAYSEAEENCRLLEEEFCNTTQPRNWGKKGLTVISKVADAQMNAFAALYFSQEKASAVVDRCRSTAKELFGVDLFKLGVEVRSFPVGEQCSISVLDLTVPLTRHSTLSRGETDLFRLIQSDGEFFSLQNDLFQSQAQDHLFSHLGAEYSRHRLALPSDLEKMFVKIAGYIDKGLTKVGEELTPENRVMYLSAPVLDRGFKVNWRYYRRGVPPEDVPFFKKAKITTKKDIGFWLDVKNTLPEETYRELLDDAGGGSSKDFQGSSHFLSF